MPIPLFDSHCHLTHLARNGSSVPDLLATLSERGFAGLLDIGIDLSGWETRLQWTDTCSWLHLSEGVHPNQAALPGFEPDWNLLRSRLAHPRVRAVGETGLDRYRSAPEVFPRQWDWLNRHTDLAEELGKPLIIHNRQTDEDFARWFRERQPVCGGVLHCFSGPHSLARQALDLGWYISFAGNLTYPANQALREIAAQIPLDRLLIETDAPYLAPVPFRGQNNSPLYLERTFSVVLSLRTETPEELGEALARNARTFLNLS